ncbi:MAG: TIGR04002 family protein [Oscillospiraceae bacterium]
MIRQKQLRYLVVSALFGAAITVVTAYALHIPIPTGGYVHLGDALIYLSACLLPAPYAIGAAAIGAGLADLLTAPMWVLPTVLIKSLVVLPFTGKSEKLLCKRNLIASVAAGLISTVLYSFAACLLLGSWNAFIPQFIGTLVQAVGSAAAFLALAAALDRVDIKKRVLSDR